jgi:hypothetical protein
MPVPKTSTSKTPAEGDGKISHTDAAGEPRTDVPVPVRCVQFPRALERRLQHRGDPPDRIVIDNEDTPDNKQRKRREEEQADMEERIRALIEEELRALDFFQKGELAVHLIHVCQEDRAEVARALYLDPTTSALRVTMWRALSAFPCGKTRGKCEGVPGCAHGRGAELWKAIMQRIISRL